MPTNTALYAQEWVNPNLAPSLNTALYAQEWVNPDSAPSLNTALYALDYAFPADPSEQLVWNGAAWVGVQQYVATDMTWKSVVSGPLPGTLPLTVPYLSEGTNGIIRGLGWMLAKQVASSQAYCNPASDTPSGAPGYPVGGYPVGAITVLATQKSDAAAARVACRAFDNVLTDNGSAANGGDAVTTQTLDPWWQCDFGAARKVSLTHVGHQNRAATSLNPASYKWQGSNDGTAWTDLTALQVGTQVSSAWHVHAVTDPTPYRFIRIQVIGASVYCALGEVEFWGTLQEAP